MKRQEKIPTQEKMAYNPSNEVVFKPDRINIGYDTFIFFNKMAKLMNYLDLRWRDKVESKRK